jgi:hypothetical protein
LILRRDPAQSGWYGVAALFNIAAFLILGITLPIVLTEGTFGAPTVKSRAFPLSNISESITLLGYTQSLSKSDSIFGMYHNSLNESCFRDYHFNTPNIVKRRLDHCHFPDHICDGRTRPIEITYLNISVYELGINSPSKLSVSHRTTCVPVITQNFLAVDRPPTHCWVSARMTPDNPEGKGWAKYYIECKLWSGSGPTDVTALPSVFGTLLYAGEEGWESLHESLRRDVSRACLIVYRAGNVGYDEAIDDPFFGAHNAVDSFFQSNETRGQTGYLPDYEATTMGCIDQWQFCVPGKHKPTTSYCRSGEMALLSGWNSWKCSTATVNSFPSRIPTLTLRRESRRLSWTQKRRRF